MKKTLMFLTVIVLEIIALSSCSKKDMPTTPAVTDTATNTTTETPNATQTAIAGLLYTLQFII